MIAGFTVIVPSSLDAPLLKVHVL